MELVVPQVEEAAREVAAAGALVLAAQKPEFTDATWGRDDPVLPDGAPELYAYGQLVDESHVLAMLQGWGDEQTARYESGEMSVEEAFRRARNWLRQKMEIGSGLSTTCVR